MIQQTKIAVTEISFLFKPEPLYEDMLKVLITLQVSSHEFESTFVINLMRCSDLLTSRRYVYSNSYGNE